MFNFQELDQATYETLRFDVIKKTEGTELLPYFDTKGLPTIGIGMNLRDDAIFDKVVTGVFGVQPSEKYYQDLKGSVASNQYNLSRTKLQNALSEIMLKRATDSSITTPNKRDKFSFTNEAEIKPVFDAIIPTYVDQRGQVKYMTNKHQS